MKKIVILGGGYAGVYAGKLLHKKFRKDDDVQITLIDKRPFHTLMTELHEVAGHRTTEDAVKVNLQKIFAGRKVDVVLDEINHIDFNKQELGSKNGKQYAYDYLVLGIGGEPAFFGVEGAKEHSFTLWSYEDALKIREHIQEMFRQAAKETNAEERRKLLTFVVAGAGFTGVEMAGELGEWKDKLCKEYHIAKEEVKLYIVDLLPTILPILSDKLIAKTERRLRKLGVEILTNKSIVNVTSDSLTINEEMSISTKTVIWTAGVMGQSFLSKTGLTLGKRGRVQTNEYLQSVDYNNVYLVGDNAYYEEEGKPIPQIVEIAHQTTETAVHNIEASIKGKEMECFKSNIHGFMVSIGGRYGVASLGKDGQIQISGFFAMLVKHLINMLYLFKIAGVNQVWTYMMHEFFHIKDRRSFVGGYFSKASPNFWLLPFRVYLGVMWLLEGLKKIDEGWLKEAKIYASNAASDAVTGATLASEAVSNAVTAAATKAAEVATDAVTAATQAVEVAADAVTAATQSAEVATDAVSAATEVAEAVSSYGEPLIKNIPGFMQWIINNIVAPNAVMFQTGMVILEIIIGILLIAGLFTFISSVVSVGMVVGITLTGMSDASILWYFFGGIALIGGAGSTFGLDYYVLPWLKKYWRKIPIVRKSYLYFD